MQVIKANILDSHPMFFMELHFHFLFPISLLFSRILIKKLLYLLLSCCIFSLIKASSSSSYPLFSYIHKSIVTKKACARTHKHKRNCLNKIALAYRHRSCYKNECREKKMCAWRVHKSNNKEHVRRAMRWYILWKNCICFFFLFSSVDSCCSFVACECGLRW